MESRVLLKGIMPWLACVWMLSATALLADDLEDTRRQIAEKFPEVSIENVAASPIPGVFEIQIGSQIAYVTADAKYLLQGSIFDLDTEENLTENRRRLARMEAVEQLGEDQMVIFAPEHFTHTVTVFTDVECGYCRKLHRQIASYNDLGIRVRYLFFPRGGPGTTGWTKAEQVWCAKDRKEALTLAKQDRSFESSDCGTTPVAREYALGQEFGIRGTPAILTETGELIGGYVPPDELIQYLAK